MIEHFTAVTIHCLCQKIRSGFRVLGIYNFGWILGLSSHIVRSFVSRRVYYVCQEAIGKGIIMLYKKVCFKFVTEFIKKIHMVVTY